MTVKLAVAVEGVEAEKFPKSASVEVMATLRVGSGLVFEPALIWKLDEAALPTPKSPRPLCPM
jgi:hypothetical protein